MRFRIRSWAPDGRPLPEMDATTNSARVAAQEASERAVRYGTWDEVSVKDGESMAITGDCLRDWARRTLEEEAHA